MQMQQLNEGSHEGLESSIVVKGNLVVDVVVAAVIVAVEIKIMYSHSKLLSYEMLCFSVLITFRQGSCQVLQPEHR